MIPPNETIGSVIVACTLRTGSNLLCELLQRNGFGHPTEFFQAEKYQNEESLRRGLSTDLLPLDQLYKKFLKLHEGHNWRGVKWNWHQFRIFTNAIGQDGQLPFNQWLPNPVWIRLGRRNRIAQAVSMCIAKRTQVWVRGDPIARELSELNYDFNAIWREFADFAGEEALWNQHLKRHSIPHVDVYYEDLITDYGAQMRRILSLLAPWRVDEFLDGELLPKDLRNQSIDNALAASFELRFGEDLNARRHMKLRTDDLVSAALAQIDGQQNDPLVSAFIGSTKGPLTIRKVDVARDLLILGDHEWVDGSHFLDGRALRLNGGASAKFSGRARKVLLEFLSHPWSGVVEVMHYDASDSINLYAAETTTRPWYVETPETVDLEVTIRATDDAAPEASGREVWLQRMWIME